MKSFNLWLILIVLAMLGCEEIISVPDISEQLITIQSPVSGAEIDTTFVQFSWIPIEFAESYQIQVATPSFSEATAVVIDTIMADSLGNIRSFEINLEPELYQWRIRASNSSYQTSYTLSDFEIISGLQFSEESIEIVRPENELITSETQVIIEWESIPQAEIYRVVVMNVETEEVLYDFNTQETIVDMDFMNIGMYEYKIRAETAIENTLFTSQAITIE